MLLGWLPVCRFALPPLYMLPWCRWDHNGTPRRNRNSAQHTQAEGRAAMPIRNARAGAATHHSAPISRNMPYVAVMRGQNRQKPRQGVANVGKQVHVMMASTCTDTPTHRQLLQPCPAGNSACDNRHACVSACLCMPMFVRCWAGGCSLQQQSASK